MDEMITVYLYGKKYTVPSSLTIMEAFEVFRLSAGSWLRLP